MFQPGLLFLADRQGEEGKAVSVDDVIALLMEERGGSRPSASLEVWRKILEGLVAAERAAILQLIGRLCIANCCGHDQSERNGISDDLAHELRVIARLMETKAPVKFKEPDAAQLRKAAAEIESLRQAVRAEREAILEVIEAERANGHLYDGAYCLQKVAAAIRARGAQT
jgi:hypothetical protein